MVEKCLKGKDETEESSSSSKKNKTDESRSEAQNNKSRGNGGRNNNPYRNQHQNSRRNNGGSATQDTDNSGATRMPAFTDSDYAPSLEVRMQRIQDHIAVERRELDALYARNRHGGPSTRSIGSKRRNRKKSPTLSANDLPEFEKAEKQLRLAPAPTEPTAKDPDADMVGYTPVDEHTQVIKNLRPRVVHNIPRRVQAKFDDVFWNRSPEVEKAGAPLDSLQRQLVALTLPQISSQRTTPHGGLGKDEAAQSDEQQPLVRKTELKPSKERPAAMMLRFLAAKVRHSIESGTREGVDFKAVDFLTPVLQDVCAVEPAWKDFGILASQVRADLAAVHSQDQEARSAAEQSLGNCIESLKSYMGDLSSDVVDATAMAGLTPARAQALAEASELMRKAQTVLEHWWTKIEPVASLLMEDTAKAWNSLVEEDAENAIQKYPEGLREIRRELFSFPDGLKEDLGKLWGALQEMLSQYHAACQRKLRSATTTDAVASVKVEEFRGLVRALVNATSESPEPGTVLSNYLKAKISAWKSLALRGWFYLRDEGELRSENKLYPIDVGMWACFWRLSFSDVSTMCLVEDNFFEEEDAQMLWPEIEAEQRSRDETLANATEVAFAFSTPTINPI